MHHDGVHAVGHGKGLEVGLDGHRQRQLVDEVDRSAGHDGTAAQVLQAEHCRKERREREEFSTRTTADHLNPSSAYQGD